MTNVEALIRVLNYATGEQPKKDHRLEMAIQKVWGLIDDLDEHAEETKHN